MNHAPLQGPVPQYVSPSYPLHEPAEAPVQTQPAPVKNVPPHAAGTIRPIAPSNKVAPPKNVAPPIKKSVVTKQAMEKKENLKPHYGIDYSIYRDKSPYPMDPRKPLQHLYWA